MRALVPTLKAALESVPPPLGSLLALLPYSRRPVLGARYHRCVKEIDRFDASCETGRQAFVLERMRAAVTHALRLPFYRELYRGAGVLAGDIRSLSDVLKLPIVTKAMLQAAALPERSAPKIGRYLVNTGGSSGMTLSFYTSVGHMASEWAHMHRVWAKVGYRQSDLKLVFAGRSPGSRPVVYDGLRHQYTANVYAAPETVIAALEAVAAKGRIRYLHGYPSALAVFADACARGGQRLVRLLRRSLKGALLGSEYPAREYRSRIEGVFGIPTVSWYGHTERTVLAWERGEPGVYHPFQTYGYCEAVPNPETGGWKLVGTSYGEPPSPFVRYDTGDDIEPLAYEGQLLKAFKIREGRIGDFVIDRRGERIPLTGLIFGRHHRLFDLAQFIQVRQPRPGEMAVLASIPGSLPSGFSFPEWFDASGLDMAVEYVHLQAPIRSKGGKVLLLVRQ